MWRGAALFASLIIATSAYAENSLRVATWKVELSGDGPGLLLRDISSDKDAEILAAQNHIKSVSPDILVLTGFDTDPDGITLGQFATQLGYQYSYTKTSNAGVQSGFDIDKDGRAGEPEDAWAYGKYLGHGGMGVLSKLPIETDSIQDFSHFLWLDLPNNSLPIDYFGKKAAAQMPLSNHGHWVVPIIWQGNPVDLLIYSAASPVFDGEEDRNGKRNADETRFWAHLLDDKIQGASVRNEFILMGNANLDPIDGEGRHEAIRTLLAHPKIQDPEPRSDFGLQNANPEHLGDPALDTVDWTDPAPGNLRVDYVLPSTAFEILDAGVAWADPENSDVSFRHGLVWVDIATIP